MKTNRRQNAFSFLAPVWLYPGMAGWHFVSLPEDLTEEINFLFADLKRGWGSIPVLVTVGSSEWKTSIFPDKKSGSYLLPLKANVRKKENIQAKDVISVSLLIRD